MFQLHFSNELLSCSQVFVACSGGIDSMVLVDVLRKMNTSVHVLHCNFGLRGDESDDDESFVRSYCEKNKIPFQVKHFAVSKLKKNENQSIQQLARDLRYNWFDEVIHLHRGALLCTAHHHDDDLEQVLLRLLSSGRILDLGGIAYSRDFIRRPLLKLAKADLLQYAKENNISWREDLSNAETNYTRNKIRLELLPLLKEIDPRYDSALTRLANEVKQLRLEAERLTDAFFISSEFSRGYFMHEKLWIDQLSVFKELFLERWKKSSLGFEEIDKLVDSEPGKRVDFGDFYVIREKSAFWFGQHSLDEVNRQIINWQQFDSQNSEEINLEFSDFVHSIKLGDEIVIDVLISGSKLHLPNGKTRKVKKIFNDQQWLHSSRKKAAGLYINGKLVQLLDFVSRRDVFLRMQGVETLLRISL